MREKRIFAERSKVHGSDEVRKKYLLVYEGKDTERIYFDAIDKNRNQIGINPLIELVPIFRCYSEKGWSNPKKILDRVLQNITESATGQITYETLLNSIISFFDEEGFLSTSNISDSTMWSTLEFVCKEKMGVHLEDIVPDLEDAFKFIVSYFSEEHDVEMIVEDLPKIIKNGTITYSEGLDKICFIIDRDRDSFFSTPGKNQYSYVLNKCREQGFGFYLSNPCFEFWLLLHFDEVKCLDTTKLLNNTRATSKRRYAEQELRKLLQGYTKSKYPAEELMTRLDTAIKNEADFCEDEVALEYSVGSRVGLLIQEMRE